jgi:AAA domain
VTSALHAPRQADETAGLRKEEAADVLRYWRALLRYEEALSSRPRARRPASGAAPPLDLAAPVAGQDYMKLPFAGAERFLLEQQGRLRQPLDAERLAFFEHWLAAKYRQVDEEARSAQFVLFPIVHSPREELLGLLRFPVEVRWWAGEQPFEVPEPVRRRGPQLLALPDCIELREQGPQLDNAVPFFVDLRLLRETLRVDGEALEKFSTLLQRQPALTGPELVLALCRLLETSIAAEGGAAPAESAPPADGPSASTGAVLDRLQRLLSQRLRQLGSGQRSFPVALVVQSERSRTTWHVQRDLEQALTLIEESGLRPETPLGAYLAGRAPQGRERVCLGRWPRAPLTPSQRQALEHALGAPFAAVQGPPGTGKTTVILNLVAHQLIEKARSLVDGGVMGHDFVLVTSTNNRAVDNVVEPLSSEAFSELPLCLRLGHRALTEKVTARTLERIHEWLSRQPEPSKPATLAAAKQAFSAALAQVEARTRVVEDAFERRALLATLLQARSELSRLGSPEGRAQAAHQARERVAALLAGGAGEPQQERALGAAAPWRSAPRAAALAVGSVIRVFDQLSEECEAESPAALQRVTSLYARLRRRQLATLAESLGAPVALAELGAVAEQAGAARLEQWADAIAHSLGPLVVLEQALEGLAQTENAAERLSALEARIAELPQEPSAAAPAALPADDATADADFRTLFERALALRSAWLCEHRAQILPSLQLAIGHARNQRSLRSLLDSPKAAGSWLRQLFPSFGCTLLSLGNALRADQPSCRQVVIDEAGQCPAAYAVSALLRAHSALLIGDTHQLEPVVGLSREDERRIQRGLGLQLSAERLGPYQMFDESGTSAQSVADRAVPLRPSLRDHFRCQPAIIALPEAWCGYGLTVRTPLHSRSHEAPRLFAAALFQDCPGSQERSAGSWINRAEGEQVVAWLLYLMQHGIAPAEVGVITPFRSQAEALARQLVAARIPLWRTRDEEEADAARICSAGARQRALASPSARCTASRAASAASFCSPARSRAPPTCASWMSA